MRILHKPVATHRPSPNKVAIITGLSDPRHCQLSIPQRQLLESLQLPEEWIVWRNFPFVETSAAPQPIPLLRASLANGSQFLFSRWRAYRRAAQPHWQALLDSTDDLYLITGSCGLQLAHFGLVDSKLTANVKIIALGPVALTSVSLAKVPVPVVTLRGDRDYLSKFFYRNVDHTIAKASHMDYWYNTDTMERIQQWLYSNISKSSVPEATFPKNV